VGSEFLPYKCRFRLSLAVIGIVVSVAFHASAEAVETAPALSEERLLFTPQGTVRQLVLADVNADGRQDVVYSSALESGASPALFVAVNDGTEPGFGNAQPVQISEAAGFGSILLEDFNGDGQPDIVVTVAGLPTRIYLNTSSAAGVMFSQVNLPAAHAVAAADVNHDGRVDLVLIGEPASADVLFLNNGGSSPFAGVTPKPLGVMSATGAGTLADFDGDGRPDFVQQTDAGLRVYVNDGTADPFVATAPVGIAANFNGEVASIRDLNGDGRADVVTVRQGNYGTFVAPEWQIYFQNGSAAAPYAEVTRLPHRGGLGIQCDAVLTQDFNGDGRVDLAFGCTNTMVKFDSSPNYSGNLYLNDGTAMPFVNARAIEIPRAKASFMSDAAYMAMGKVGGRPTLLVANTSLNPGVRAYGLIDDQLPVAAADSASTHKNQPVQIELLANDSDSDGTLSPMSRRIVSLATHGTVNVLTNGAVTYVPEQNFTGIDTFQYSVRDNNAAESNIATVTVNVMKTGGGGATDLLTLALLGAGLLLRRCGRGGSTAHRRPAAIPHDG